MSSPITSTTINNPEPQVPSTTIDNLIPGATVPTTQAPDSNGTSDNAHTILPPAVSMPGPEINGRPTTITLHNTTTIHNAPVMSSLVPMVNAAFSLSHKTFSTLPAEELRLANAEQYYMELGSDPSTFLYVLTWADDGDNDTAIGTAAGMRFYGNDSAMVMLPDGTTRHTVFKRLAQPPPDTDVWELRHMAVDVGLQRKGVAGVLMGLIEREVERRFKESTQVAKTSSSKLVMFLTTVKESNEVFYAKKGYTTDQEVAVEKGYRGSVNGFTVLHMSKSLNSSS